MFSLLCRKLLICACLLFLLPAEARSGKFSRDGIPDNVVLPQGSVIRLSSSPRQGGVGISKAAVSVLAEGAHVETVWSLTLRNSGESRQEAVITLPVPEGALLKGFSYGPEGEERSAPYPARLMPAGEARSLYDRIVARAKDPALLEFAGYGMVRSSVFPVEAHASVVVNITYEQVLTPVDGRYEYVLPRTESSSGLPLNLRMEIRPSSALVYSPTHELAETRLADGGVSVRLTKAASRVPGPFRLYWRERGSSPRSWASMTMFACPGTKEGQGYFLLFGDFLPPSQSSPREVTLVIDRSGSMRGEKLARAKEAARCIVKSLGERDSFNLIAYNEGVDCFSAAPVSRTPGTERAAGEWLDAVQARGGTNIQEALKVALSAPLREGLLPVVLFLTDGQPTIGETDEREIIRFASGGNSSQRRLFTLGLGTDVNAPLLRKLSEVSRAEASFIFPGEDVLEKMVTLEKKLREPAFTAPALTVCDLSGNPAPGLVSDVVPSALTDVFAGSPLVVCGRYSCETAMVFHLRGKRGGEEVSCKVVFEPSKTAMIKHDFVPRIWAARKIGELQGTLWDQGMAGGAGAAGRAPAGAREVMDEMIRLSVEFGVMTNFTSFFADDGQSSSPFRSLSGNGMGVSVTAEEKGRYFDQFSRERSGASAFTGNAQVAQLKKQVSLSEKGMVSGAVAGKKEKAEASLSGVRQLGGASFYRQGQVWVENSLMTREGETISLRQKHDRVIRPGTPEFSELVDRLVQENRQAVFALEGDVNFQLGSEFILLKNR